MHHYDGYERWAVLLLEYNRCYIYINMYIYTYIYLHVLGQIIERDGTVIVPPDFQRYEDAESVNFIENNCKFCIFEGIHRHVVSAAA